VIRVVNNGIAETASGRNEFIRLCQHPYCAKLRPAGSPLPWELHICVSAILHLFDHSSYTQTP